MTFSWFSEAHSPHLSRNLSFPAMNLRDFSSDLPEDNSVKYRRPEHGYRTCDSLKLQERKYMQNYLSSLGKNLLYCTVIAFLLT